MNPKTTKSLLILCGVISAVSLLAFVLMLGVHIPSFGIWFYCWQYETNNTYTTVGMYPADLHEVTRHMIAYLQGRVDYLQIDTIVNGIPRPFFSDIEIRHMVDVKDLSVISIWVRNIAGIVFALSIVPFIFFVRAEKKPKQRAKRKRAVRRYLFGPWQNITAGLLASVLVLAFIISIDWMAAWVLFHLIFFSNDYWILNPTMDLLINITPAEFFMAISAFVGGFFAAGMIFMLVISRILLRRSSTFAKICLLLSVISILGMLQTLGIFNVLGVLRIIGIVLSCIIGFILLIFGLALFSKLRYNVVGAVVRTSTEADLEEGAATNLKYAAKATWFLGLIRFTAKSGEEHPPMLSIFGKKIPMVKPENAGDTAGDAVLDIPLPELEATLPKPPKRKGRLKAKWGKLKSYIEMYEEIDEKIGIRSILNVSWLAIKRVIKKVKPKEFKLRGILGLNEPDQTGMAMAAASAISALGLDIILQGNFEEKEINLNLTTKGSFSLATLLWIGIRFWFAKPIRSLRKFVKGKNPKHKIKKREKRKDVENGYRI